MMRADTILHGLRRTALLTTLMLTAWTTGLTIAEQEAWGATDCGSHGQPPPARRFWYCAYRSGLGSKERVRLARQMGTTVGTPAAKEALLVLRWLALDEDAPVRQAALRALVRHHQLTATWLKKFPAPSLVLRRIRAGLALRPTDRKRQTRFLRIKECVPIGPGKGRSVRVRCQPSLLSRLKARECYLVAASTQALELSCRMRICHRCMVNRLIPSVRIDTSGAWQIRANLEFHNDTGECGHCM